MQIQAAVLDKPGSDLIVETLELDSPKQGEVLVRLGAAGVCHSDYHVMSGRAGHDLPVVLGHEGAGMVVSVGEDVDRVVPGDHVVLSWIPFCGECFYCRHDKTYLCKAYLESLWAGTMPDGSCRLSRDGNDVRHLSMLACWADHAVVPQQSCIVMRKDIPFEVAALLGCAVTTGVGAVVNRAQVEPDSSVAVFGAGGVGLSIIMGARLARAAPIIVVDTCNSKEAMAHKLGATHFLLAGPRVVRQVKDLTAGRGADYVFEAVGNTKVQEICLQATRPGGMLTFVGMPGDDETMALPSAGVTRDEKTVTGSIFGSARTDRDFTRFAELYLKDELPIDALISRRYGLKGINQACRDMLQGGAGRGVVVFDGVK